MQIKQPRLPKALLPYPDVQTTLSRARQEGDTLHGIQFSNLQLTELSGIRFAGCSFERCSFAAAAAQKSSFTDCRFHGCDLSGASLTACRSEQLALDGCRILGASFFQTPLAGIDFTTCILEGITVSDDGHELRGAVVSPMQAAALAKLLGLIVKQA